MAELATIVKYDNNGKLICPICGDTGQVKPGDYVRRGVFPCEKGHLLCIDDDTAYAINDILAKQNEHRWRRDVLKGFEETPSFMVHKEGKNKIIIP